jgi:hypothetical protein
LYAVSQETAHRESFAPSIEDPAFREEDSYLHCHI